jgi:hypothetical protein
MATAEYKLPGKPFGVCLVKILVATVYKTSDFLPRGAVTRRIQPSGHSPVLALLHALVSYVRAFQLTYVVAGILIQLDKLVANLKWLFVLLASPLHRD